MILPPFKRESAELALILFKGEGMCIDFGT
jgi:hypothetical protein